jgi:hypothetical protein
VNRDTATKIVRDWCDDYLECTISPDGEVGLGAREMIDAITFALNARDAAARPPAGHIMLPSGKTFALTHESMEALEAYEVPQCLIEAAEAAQRAVGGGA